MLDQVGQQCHLMISVTPRVKSLGEPKQGSWRNWAARTLTRSLTATFFFVFLCRQAYGEDDPETREW